VVKISNKKNTIILQKILGTIVHSIRHSGNIRKPATVFRPYNDQQCVVVFGGSQPSTSLSGYNLCFNFGVMLYFKDVYNATFNALCELKLHTGAKLCEFFDLP